MAFRPSAAVTGRDIKYGLIDNSQTLSIGELIIPGIQGDASVCLTGGGTTGDLLGVVLGIVGAGGKVLELNSKAAAADNVTVAQIKVAYYPMYIPTEYVVDLDAASEVTDNSSGYGNFATEATGLLLGESSWAAFGTKTNKQFFSFGLTGNSTTEVSCRCIATLVA